MAGQTKTTSGAVTTYVITDVQGNTVTTAVTQTAGAGTTCTFSSTGNVHQDAQQMMMTLMQLVSTGLLP